MKIAYISSSSIPSRTANSIHVMKMCQAFAENGHEVTLLAPKLNKYDENLTDSNLYRYYGVKNCFKISRYFSRKVKGKSIINSLTIFKIIKKINPNLVYGRYLPGCVSSAIRYKTIYEAHEPVFKWQYGIVNIMFFNVLSRLKKFKKLVVISDSLKNIFLEKNKIRGSKVVVLHDASDYQPDNKKILQASQKIKIGYFGHLYKGRGVDIIIKISSYFQEMEFHVVGGNEMDIKYWEKKITNKNIFFHGFVHPKDVYKYRNSCDILVAPYQREVAISGNIGNTIEYMSPLKIFEYMSSAKPIIASDIKVLREVLNDNNSILVECDNVEQWIGAINDLISDKNKMEILACNAYNDFVKKYTWKKRASKILSQI